MIADKALAVADDAVRGRQARARRAGGSAARAARGAPAASPDTPPASPSAANRLLHGGGDGRRHVLLFLCCPVGDLLSVLACSSTRRIASACASTAIALAHGSATGLPTQLGELGGLEQPSDHLAVDQRRQVHVRRRAHAWAGLCAAARQAPLAAARVTCPQPQHLGRVATGKAIPRGTAQAGIAGANIVRMADEQVGERASFMPSYSPAASRTLIAAAARSTTGEDLARAQQPERCQRSPARSSQLVPRKFSVPDRDVFSGDDTVDGGRAGCGVTGS